jgi:flagellar biogenesis protein FliO
MSKNRTKTMVVLAVVIFIVTATTTAAPNESKPNESQQGIVYKSNLAAPQDPNFSLNTGNQLSTGEMFLKLMLTMLIVVALGIAAFYMSKRLGSKIVNISGRKIKLIETFHLGSRKAIHLIEVQNHRILIGSTQTTITKLVDLTDMSSLATGLDETLEEN